MNSKIQATKRNFFAFHSKYEDLLTDFALKTVEIAWKTGVKSPIVEVLEAVEPEYYENERVNAEHLLSRL